MKTDQPQATKILLGLALAGSLAFSSVLLVSDAQGKDRDMKAHMEEFYDAVDASDAQEKQLDTLHAQYMAQMQPIQQTIAQRKAELAIYILSPGATMDEAMRRETELQQLKAQQGHLAIEEAFAKKAILSPEQQQKAAAFLQNKANEMRKNPPANMSD